MEERKQIRLPEVCRCGKMHNLDDFDEVEAAIHHNCYHSGGIIPMASPEGDVGPCAQCGMHFRFTGAPTGTFYPCPVCFFSCEDECKDYNICDCCGTEFGSDDEDESHLSLRLKWLSTEPRPLFFMKDKEPAHWNPYLQLAGSWRHEGVKCCKTVSREEMEELFKTSGVKDRIEAGEFDSEVINEAEIVPAEPKIS